MVLLILAFPLESWAASPKVLPDTMAQRAMACVACHSSKGQMTNDGYFPRIVGKPAGYLYNQLINFKTGRRQNAMMHYITRYLSDAYLKELALYFSKQHVPYPQPSMNSAQPSVLQHGRTLVLTGDPSRKLPACASCHGSNLMGVAPDVPGLLGLSQDYLEAQLNSWSNGVRRAQEPDCMKIIDQKLTGEDISAVTAWLAAQRVPDNREPLVASDDFKELLPLKCGSLNHAKQEF